MPPAAVAPRRSPVVVVTGASSGVGRAIARRLGGRGARVGLIARGVTGLLATRAEIESSGGEAMVLPLDVADAGAVDTAAELVVERWGHIDVWINNAMVSVFAPVAQVTAEEYRRVTEVTYLGTVHGTCAALRHMRRRDRGTVLQIGSALAYRSIPLQSAYCAAKAAIRGFTDSLRCELDHDHSGIRVQMLQLPAVNTPQFDVVRNKLGKHAQPVPPIFQPELIADAVEYALAHPRRERWIGASTIAAIVGERLFPGLLDRYLARKAWDAQTTDELPPHARDNLEEPLELNLGAHGAFDPEAHANSVAWWLRTHAAPFVAAGAAALVGLGAYAWSRR
ncbi:MAG: SDR family oxidoreductase [Deltaproteobacteria bacterium]|nr:SDR family oxidoreductase [Deltaproteobacteria bacterium]